MIYFHFVLIVFLALSDLNYFIYSYDTILLDLIHFSYFMLTNTILLLIFIF